MSVVIDAHVVARGLNAPPILPWPPLHLIKQCGHSCAPFCVHERDGYR